MKKLFWRIMFSTVYCYSSTWIDYLAGLNIFFIKNISSFLVLWCIKLVLENHAYVDFFFKKNMYLIKVFITIQVTSCAYAKKVFIMIQVTSCTYAKKDFLLNIWNLNSTYSRSRYIEDICAKLIEMFLLFFTDH